VSGIVVEITLGRFDHRRPVERQTYVAATVPAASAFWRLPAGLYAEIAALPWDEALDAVLACHRETGLVPEVRDERLWEDRESVRVWLADGEHRAAMRSAWLTQHVERDPLTRSLHERVIAQDAEIERLRGELQALRSERSGRHDGLAAAVGYWSGTEWPDLIAVVTAYTTTAIVLGQGRDRLMARVAELEAERRKYVGAEPTIAEGTTSRTAYPPVLPWAALMDDEDLAGFLDEVADVVVANEGGPARLAEVEAACARWRLIAEAQHAHNTAPGPDVQPDGITRLTAPTQALQAEGGAETGGAS
jgi:hypothetical protein